MKKQFRTLQILPELNPETFNCPMKFKQLLFDLRHDKYLDAVYVKRDIIAINVVFAFMPNLIKNQNSLMYFLMLSYLTDQYNIVLPTYKTTEKFTINQIQGHPFFKAIVTPRIKACYYQNDNTITWIEDANGAMIISRKNKTN